MQLPPGVRAYAYDDDGLEPGVHRGLPSPWLTWIVTRDAPLRTAVDDLAHARGEVHVDDVVLSGFHTRATIVEQSTRWSGMQIEVHPLAARRLLGVPAGALPVDRFSAVDVLGRSVVELHERLQGIDDPTARAAATGRHLTALAAAGDDRSDVRPEVAEAWRWLARRRGAGRIDDLCAHVGLGRRRLAQLFTAEVGVTPKTVARVMRFDAARHAIAGRVAAGAVPGRLDLAGVAADHGYVDHAHLVREFGDLAGLSPTDWVRTEVTNIQASVDLRGPQ